MESNLNVVPLTPMVQRCAAGFCSGNDYLDNFLKSTMALNAAYGKTYVWLTEDNKRIIGYYSLGTGYLERVLKDEKSRVKLGGSIHINGFALDRKYHGAYQGVTEDGEKINLSDILLGECIERIYRIRENIIGFSFITLGSSMEGYSLYKRNAFEILEDDMSFSVEEAEKDCILMYLPLDYEEL